MGLLIAAFVAGCAAREPPEVASEPCAEASRTELRGALVIEHGDPPGGGPGIMRYILSMDRNVNRRLKIEPHQLEALGPVSMLQGQRVVITADTLHTSVDGVLVCTVSRTNQ